MIEHPPEPPPVLELASEAETPGALTRSLWLDSLAERVRGDLPVEDLLAWLVERHPGKETSDVLSGFSRLVFHHEFSARFTDRLPRAYETADGEIKASPLTLASL